jgi:hypothetical protein
VERLSRVVVATVSRRFLLHPLLDLDYLKRAIARIEAAGYTFVSPASL